jgi:hypothetical protein
MVDESLCCGAGVTANAHVTISSKQLSKERTSKYTTKGRVSKNDSSVVIACSLAASRLVLDCARNMYVWKDHC